MQYKVENEEKNKLFLSHSCRLTTSPSEHGELTPFIYKASKACKNKEFFLMVQHFCS
jgi:hypothetical protein